jgi:hypothetical protein
VEPHAHIARCIFCVARERSSRGRARALAGVYYTRGYRGRRSEEGCPRGQAYHRMQPSREKHAMLMVRLVGSQHVVDYFF